MTNDEFIIGLIEIGVQKGYNIPDRDTDTKYLDKGMFTFLYNGEIIKLERDNRGMGMVKKEKKHFFRTLIKGGEAHYITEETYDRAKSYFYNNTDYTKLKKKLEKDLRKEKLERIENEM